MALHAEDALAGAGIAQVFDLALAVATLEAVGAEGLVAGQDREVLDLVAACAAAIGAVVADEGSVAEKKEIGVGVEESATGVATEAVDVPSIAGYSVVSVVVGTRRRGVFVPNSKALPSSRIYRPVLVR